MEKSRNTSNVPPYSSHGRGATPNSFIPSTHSRGKEISRSEQQVSVVYHTSDANSREQTEPYYDVIREHNGGNGTSYITVGADEDRIESSVPININTVHRDLDLPSLDGTQNAGNMAEMTLERPRARISDQKDVENPSYESDDETRLSNKTDSAQTIDVAELKDRDSNEIEDEINKFLSEDNKTEEEAAKRSDECLGIVVNAEDVQIQEVVEPTLDTVPSTSTKGDKSNKESALQNSLVMNIPKLMMMFDKTGEEATGEPEVKSQANSYLILAVRNDSPHLVERLLDKSSAFSIYTALLFSINLGRDHITKVFLDHPKYESVRQVTKLTKKGVLHGRAAQIDATDQHLTEDADDSVLSADVTPLMLAAQKNQFEVVRNLMAMGERIEEPHSRGCKCEECSQQTDELREAKTRLSTYKALSSDAYIVLANTDPIFIAFELGQKLRKLAVQEKHYKADYLNMATKCGNLCGRLLDRVRDGEELDTLLNEKSGSGLSAYDNLARLKLAIHHREKKFVAHPACQKKIASLWVGSLNPSWIENPWKVLLFLLCLTICYPFVAILYWIYPKTKIGEVLRIPMVKFAASTCSYIVFLALLIGYSATEERHAGALSEHQSMGPLYQEYRNQTSFLYAEDVKLRYNAIGAGTITLCIWILGMIWDNTKKLYHEKFMYFTENQYNILDFVMLFLYIISFCFRFAAFSLVKQSVEYFSDEDGWNDLANNDSTAINRLYWLDADRETWKISDPAIIAEVLFGIASLLSICKLTHVFTINERIGPLLISLAKMLEDVFAFMVIFVFIIAAFVVAFHNLFWYFYYQTDENDDPQNQFGNLAKIIEQCFWSIFGLVEMDDNMFATSSVITTVTAHIIFAFYNWMMIVILINMLIAMMSRSYEFIAALEDVEWKFARTKLFLEYIRDDATLAVPFNLVPTWKGVYLLSKRFSNDWCRRCAGRKPKPAPSALTGNKFLPGPNQSNMLYSLNLNGKPGTAINVSTETGKSLQKWADHLEQKVGRGKRSNKEPSDEYKVVIKEVVKRFIQQYGKGKGGDDTAGDSMDQLQKDMSTLRQEIMSNIFRQNTERAEISQQVTQIDRYLVKSRESFTQQHTYLKSENDARVDEVKASVAGLETQVQLLSDTTNDTLMDLQRQIIAHMQATNASMEILKDGMFRLCADVTMLRGGGALSRDVFIRKEEGSESSDPSTSGPQRPVGARLSVNGSHTSGGNDGSSTAYGEFGPIRAKARKVARDN